MIHRNGMASQRSLGSLNTGRKLSDGRHTVSSYFTMIGMPDTDAGANPEAHLTIQGQNRKLANGYLESSLLLPSIIPNHQGRGNH